jgi:mono/diheme cytochrome c family protein
MNKVLIGVLVGILLAILVGGVESAKAQERELGANIFTSKCMICHGPNGDGKGRSAALLNPKPRDFTYPAFWQGDVEKKIFETVRNGKGMMPSFNLKSEEINAIIIFMAQTFKKQ